MPDVSSLNVHRLTEGEAAAGRVDLIDLLADAIDDGASIGFVLPFGQAELSSYWQEVEAAIRKGSRHLLVARVDGRIVGAVQLDCALKANARHRAEVQKLMVHRRARRRGIGRRLMQTIEPLALSLGRSLLVLDLRLDDPAQALYESLGYRRTGIVPRYACDPDGTLNDCLFMHKELVRAPEL
jgi:ribosomal protein S18 acetylase RimI-like enzyme